MANPEHVRLFFEHKLWDEWREYYPHILPDLRATDFSGGETRTREFQRVNGSGSIFHYMDLTLANFDEACLVGASLSCAFLAESSFVGADLRNADLFDGMCSCVNMSSANLQGAFLVGAIMNDAKLCAADLRKATLRKATLDYSDLRGANLTGIHASECNLYDVNVAGADLTGADFRWADLSKTNIVEARNGLDLMHLKLRGAYLCEINLRGALMREMDLRKVDFQQADLRGADLRGANLTKASFDQTMVEGTLFDDALVDWDQVTRSNGLLTSKHKFYSKDWEKWDNDDDEEEWEEA
ncbi:pentapeptide repeat-containing protein [Dictyobacter vulcani]|nr:pentapeptide repeat-containing protein [Dictyobacter vulcani]